MLQTDKVVHTTDFGTGRSGVKQVSTIARRELESPRCAQLLFRLVEFLSHDAKRPLHILELGTSLGISTAYLAMAESRNSVTTFEGSKEVADLALQNWQKLDIHNIHLVRGNIDETLLTTLEKDNKLIDLAYLDANHTYEATMRYYNIIGTRTHEKSIIVLDDIYHSPDMQRAWREISARPEVTTTMDLYHMGILFLDPHYLKRHYRIRL